MAPTGTAVLDAQGKSGIWDIFRKMVGTKGVPGNTSTPWGIACKDNTMITAYPDGRVTIGGRYALLASLQ